MAVISPKRSNIGHAYQNKSEKFFKIAANYGFLTRETNN